MLEEHNEIVRDVISSRGGVVFHNTGDGYGIWFTNADDAVWSATEVHRRLSRVGPRPLAPIEVRIGIATGRPLSLDGDLFGIDVVRASRLSALVGAGETAIDAATAGALSRAQGTPLGLVALKGFVEPELFTCFALPDHVWHGGGTAVVHLAQLADDRFQSTRRLNVGRFPIVTMVMPSTTTSVSVGWRSGNGMLSMHVQRHATAADPLFASGPSARVVGATTS